MFNDELKIILYADDVKKSNAFWQSLGLPLINLEVIDGALTAELALSKTSGTHLVIYDRNFVAENTPDASEPAPALIFSSDDVVTLYKKMQEQGVETGDLAQIGEEYVFNFADLDGNYFVVSGK